MQFILPSVLITLTLAFSAGVRADSPSHQVVMDRGLSYLASAGDSWIAKRGCVSCHQIPTLLWSHHAAARSGDIELTAELEHWTSWATDVVNFVKPEQKSAVDPHATMASNIDTMVAMLLAVPRETDQGWRDRFVANLVSEQGEDGAWKACGQLPLQRRPAIETNAVTTFWTTLVLIQQDASFDRDAAIAFADSVVDPKSIEWYAAGLLVADATKDPDLDSKRQRLIDLQNDDGGWGWRVAESSDALGTGYALYALAKVGADQASLSSAREFLFRTQTPSGRWIVPGTKTSAKRKPTATANDWGTAWAVIAIAESK
ncbi:hypothetical protein K227x_33480 [Rubripirellula lacrimiformis]|uniref:Prenyltransferase and squalene oxidase repeat protein n=1 Tax=Rubripirellula lacrimiformis TaxID=1930273 RepID=A0A517NCT9_9BACT|nr:squalene--hopene cyclase [Rubripirellula lacrimiformis]QDT04950.1 hypothetical protein K227x_33480 [Rubripirellula lacrimiformis]